VHPHPSGLLIEHLDPLATRFVSSPALAQDDPRRAVYGTLGAPLADWVVSGDGQLIGLSSVEVIQDAVTRPLAPLRLDEGAYGNCAECETPIATARLRALPFALRCTACEGARESRAAARRPTATPASRVSLDHVD
jgi:hypothetical protein